MPIEPLKPLTEHDALMLSEVVYWRLPVDDEDFHSREYVRTLAHRISELARRSSSGEAGTIPSEAEDADLFWFYDYVTNRDNVDPKWRATLRRILLRVRPLVASSGEGLLDRLLNAMVLERGWLFVPNGEMTKCGDGDKRAAVERWLANRVNGTPSTSALEKDADSGVEAASPAAAPVEAVEPPLDSDLLVAYYEGRKNHPDGAEGHCLGVRSVFAFAQKHLAQSASRPAGDSEAPRKDWTVEADSLRRVAAWIEDNEGYWHDERTRRAKHLREVAAFLASDSRRAE